MPQGQRSLFLYSVWDGRLGGSAGVSPAAFGVLAECKEVCNGTLQTATGTVALPRRIPQGQRVAPARRTKLGDDGNQMKADGNSFPDSSLGWTID